MTSACGTEPRHNRRLHRSLGKNYVITLQATTLQGGATTGSGTDQRGDKEHVLKALGTAATAMRAKLDRSSTRIQNVESFRVEQANPSPHRLELSGYLTTRLRVIAQDWRQGIF